MSFAGGKTTEQQINRQQTPAHHVLGARRQGSDHDPLTFLHQRRKGGELSSRDTTQSPEYHHVEMFVLKSAGSRHSKEILCS